ncbi:ABC transporter family substrate-binding protein [Streptomyces sp. NPDC088354]|uniref:ABC transporter family substrate-binding protein n=1 Tax=unclassified Streptomyces TaxID=2593676 RepID=UPI0029AF5AFC|nr:ABC transporter family substrate-binding protein [Streptomyces sp. MI02-7b]MDX3072119.1 ABC transporter family substrate-binding protein [Streptomyces sp. MI02-7b]
MARSAPLSPPALATALALALATLAGCSAGREDPLAGTDLASAPRDAVRDGGTLRWAVDTAPATLNAFQSPADDTTDLVAAAVLPATFRLDGSGRPQRDADLLESAQVVEREPRQVVSYKLNPKAVWSDGRAVSTADFAAQWKALRGKDEAYWAARNAGYDRIASVAQGKEPGEVRVTFARRFADWQSLFTPLYPKSVTGTAAAFNDSARRALPVAGGPFKVQKVTAKDVTLVRNPRWWGDRARLDRLVLAAVPAHLRAAGLADGSLDMAKVDRTPKIKGVSVYRTRSASYTQLALNGADGPLADERVRRAVARAVDRQEIARSVLKPVGLPDEPLGNHLLLASQAGYADHSSALGESDPKAAQAQLADAGWRRTALAPAGPAERNQAASARKVRVTVVEPSTTVLRKNGKALTLRFVLPESNKALDAVGDRIAAMLSGIGVRTEIQKVSDESFLRDHLAAGDFDLALYSWPGTAFPATDTRPIYAKPEAGPDGSLVVAQNFPRVGTDQIDQLLDQASGELDPGTARDLAARADARIWAVAGSLPLFQRPELVALRSSVRNAGAFGFATPRFQDIGFRK